MKNLTNLCKTVETGVDSRLSLTTTQIFVVTHDLLEWNFCTCLSDVISWGNQWQQQKSDLIE